MAKHSFPEAQARLFQRMFVCMQCGAKMRTDTSKIKANKVKCRKCKAKSLRAIHKEKK